jgi:hypothetical protein
MFSKTDIIDLQERGISVEKVTEQINTFKRGFPYLKLFKAARIQNGIKPLDPELISKYIKKYESAQDRIKLKFVPASGAASRMFKALFEFRSAYKNSNYDPNLLNNSAYKQVSIFFKNIKKFAFYSDLKSVLQHDDKDIDELVRQNKLCVILDALFNADGLNYENLPKGLLKFHTYGNSNRTAVEEHMVEGAMIAKNSDGTVKIHFTVLPEHKSLFQQVTDKIKDKYESEYNVKYDISYSIQKPSTDTVAVNVKNEPFRTKDGSILFRPGGHGSLIENLNEIDADIILIKNIDNVVPDKRKSNTAKYKKVLAGALLEYQEKIFNYLNLLNSSSSIQQPLADEIIGFIKNELCILCDNTKINSGLQNTVKYLIKVLNRPLRVCGMVKNEGEPGGGPFWVKNLNGDVSLQIVEKSQIDSHNYEQNAILSSSTHFNPVDIVCGINDYKGNKFELHQFIDPNTGFISKKTKEGKPLKALELPGLWNGAMSDWNTIFIEVPISTFNPVKTINDLLRAEHQ